MAEGRKGFFRRLVEDLAETHGNIVSGVDPILSDFSAIDDSSYEKIGEILVMDDLGIQTTMFIAEDLRKRVREQHTQEPRECKEPLINSIKEQVDLDENAYKFEYKESVILIIGINGVGKTTSVDKLVGQLKDDGCRVILAAVDIFQAATTKQLTEWISRVGVELIAQQGGSDPMAVVYGTMTAVKLRKADVLICGTTGRLHNKKNLMGGFKKIDRIIGREYPDAYREILVALDDTTRQNALAQVRQFMKVADITDIILTKLDGIAKGGTTVAIQSELETPVKCIRIGERIDDLQKFSVDGFINALFHVQK